MGLARLTMAAKFATARIGENRVEGPSEGPRLLCLVSGLLKKRMLSLLQI